MKSSFILRILFVTVIGTALSFSLPVLGQEPDMLNQALDLVHQAWNPGGDPPSNDQRTTLLKQALKLAQDAPEHHLRGHRAKAIEDINSALAELANGDPSNRAADFIRDADSELRTALSIAQ